MKDFDNQYLKPVQGHPLAYAMLRRPGMRRREYNVYTDAFNYVYVEASSAVEAIKASDVTFPFKVERIRQRMANIIELSDLEVVDTGDTLLHDIEKRRKLRA